jgi:hypothetical protein
MKKNVESLDALITGIKQLLLESRCSFSDEEKSLLDNCILALEKAKERTKNSGYPDLGLIAKAVELLTKLFIAGEHLKDIF